MISETLGSLSEGLRIKVFQLVIDAKSLIYINGTEVDFQKDGLNEGFEFNNPNSKAECGCGESFTV